MLRPVRSPDVTPLRFYALASWKEKTTSTEQESDMKNSSRISLSLYRFRLFATLFPPARSNLPSALSDDF